MTKIQKILLWILSLQCVGYLIGLLTQANITGWYNHLNKSPLNPPQIVFPIAWSILYIMIAIAGFLLFELKSDNKAVKWSKIFFLVQLFLNWLWTPVFFGLHNISLGFYWIVFIALFTLLTIISAFNQCRFASILLIPYFLWLIFASYLNFFILMHN